MRQYDMVRGDCMVLYIGTYKLIAMVGNTKGDAPTVYEHVEMVRPQGFTHGHIAHLQQAFETTENLLNRLKYKNRQNLPTYVVLGGGQMKTYEFESCEYYSAGAKTISTHEVRSVVDQTRSIASIPLNESILQVVPDSFLVNDVSGIQNPMGLEADRLGVKLKISTMESGAFRNIHKMLEALDIHVRGYYPKTFTLSEAVLRDEEKMQGAVIIDIADDLTQAIFWKNSTLMGSMSIERGGKSLSQFISKNWNLELHDAEKVKEKYARFHKSESYQDELIPLVRREGHTYQSVKRGEFEESILDFSKGWMSGILKEIQTELEEYEIYHPHFYFTGGTLQIDGFLEWVHKEFEINGKVGVVHGIDAPAGLMRNPAYVPVLGMFQWVVNYSEAYAPLFSPRGVLEKTVASAKNWLANYF